ncbi:MAG: hypothetical protein ABSB42_23570 [Tepidisphaeraceae bacterium]|jgi:hypothetical protein
MKLTYPIMKRTMKTMSKTKSMKRKFGFDDAFIECLWHSNEIAILLEWLHKPLEAWLADVSTSRDTKSALALDAELVPMREQLKRVFRKVTHIRPQRLDKALAVESCRDDKVARARLNRLQARTKDEPRDLI